MGIIAAIISFLGSIISWFTGKKEAAGVPILEAYVKLGRQPA